jgi:ribosome-associated translation inhibitor RaiA
MLNQLSPNIQKEVAEQLEKLAQHLPDDAKIRSFCGIESKHHGECRFTVLLQVYWQGHQVVTRVSGENLYPVILRAMAGMRKDFFNLYAKAA